MAAYESGDKVVVKKNAAAGEGPSSGARQALQPLVHSISAATAKEQNVDIDRMMRLLESGI